MLEILVLVASLIADAAIGYAAMKMAKSNSAVLPQLTKLMSDHGNRLDNHEVRIVILEKKVA